MDTNTIVLAALIILAIICVVGFFFYRQRSKVKITLPLNVGFELDSSNPEAPTPPAVKMDEIKSHRGNIIAEDNTGRGTEMRRAEAHKDIRASSTPPESNSHPKA